MQRTPRLLKSSSSNRWLARQAQDPFVRARAEGASPAGPALRARSGFKLAELAKKHRGLLHGRAVVDLGAAPGGWTQVAAAAVGRQRGGGAVVAVDLLPMEEIKGVRVVQGDFLDPAVWDEVRGHLRAAASGRRSDAGRGPREDSGRPTRDSDSQWPRAVADTVLSDMMAAMSGVRVRDVQASLDLVTAATEFAHQVLRPAAPPAEPPAAPAAGSGEPSTSARGPSGVDAELAPPAAERKRGKDARAAHSEASKGYPGGSLVLKFFLHPDLLAFRKAQLDPFFARVVTEKPKASRSQSSEAYWVCLGYKGRPVGPPDAEG